MILELRQIESIHHNFLNVYVLISTKEKGVFNINGGRATDRHSSDRPFNRPTDQRNPTEKYHGKNIQKLCYGPIRFLATALGPLA